MKFKKQIEHFAVLETKKHDFKLGERLSEIIGDTGINHNIDSPFRQWTMIAKALRVHGICLR
jgi:hypothetical protein